MTKNPIPWRLTNLLTNVHAASLMTINALLFHKCQYGTFIRSFKLASTSDTFSRKEKEVSMPVIRTYISMSASPSGRIFRKKAVTLVHNNLINIKCAKKSRQHLKRLASWSKHICMYLRSTEILLSFMYDLVLNLDSVHVYRIDLMFIVSVSLLSPYPLSDMLWNNSVSNTHFMVICAYIHTFMFIHAMSLAYISWILNLGNITRIPTLFQGPQNVV